MWPSWEQTLLIFVAAFLEGAVGFDFGLIAAPAVGALLGVREAVILLSLPNLLLMALRALGGGIPTAPLQRLMPFIGAGSVGAAVGVLALVSIPPTILMWGVGLFALLCAGYSLSRLRLELDLRDETFFAYLAGFLSGWFTGLAYAGGPVAVIFLDSLRPGRARLVKMTYICALAFAAVQVAALTGAGALPPSAVARSAMAILPALAGFLAGRLLRGRFSPALGYAVGLGLLIAAALSLIAFGPGGWR